MVSIQPAWVPVKSFSFQFKLEKSNNQVFYAKIPERYLNNLLAYQAIHWADYSRHLQCSDNTGTQVTKLMSIWYPICHIVHVLSRSKLLTNLQFKIFLLLSSSENWSSDAKKTLLFLRLGIWCLIQITKTNYRISHWHQI